MVHCTSRCAGTKAIEPRRCRICMGTPSITSVVSVRPEAQYDNT